MRGWCVTEDGKKLVLDEMLPGGKSSEGCFKSWTQEDGYFVMRMQSCGFRKSEKPESVILERPGEWPEFMADEKLKTFYKLPAEMAADKNPVELTGEAAKVRVNVTDCGTSPEADLYWGETNGMTFDDREMGTDWWQNKTKVAIRNGVNDFRIPGLKSNTTYYWQLRVKNEEGTTWLYDVESFKTR